MHISFLSTRSFKEKRTMHPSKPTLYIEVNQQKFLWVLTQKMSLIHFLIHFNSQETSNERGSEFTPDSVELLYYDFQIIGIRRAESYIMSPHWIGSKKARIYPKKINIFNGQ